MGITSEKAYHGSRRLKGTLIIAIVLLAGVMAALFINYRYSTNPAEQPEVPEETGATLSISRFAHTAMKNGKKEWTLHADTARLFSESRKAALSRLEAVFFMENGEQIRMKADRGEVDMASKNLRAWDNVVVRSPEYTLKTETLNYTYDSRIMVIDAPLEIAGDTMTFTADSAHYEMDDNTAFFEGNIETWLVDTIGP
ncbi:MAG: LPS export ABC transporter periplasmic protein LptC [Desulfosalsimonadaceae bacterium]